MAASKRTATVRTCPQGHSYRKSSDCPTCPTCEGARRPEGGLLAGLSAPARRALERAGLTTVSSLARHTRDEILALHGVGPSTMPKLERALVEAGLAFRR